MFERFKKWWRSDPADTPPPRGPLRQDDPGDWVVLPFRIAEACRLSMITIAQHPEMPEKLKLWIAQWLGGYNLALLWWFEQNYGKDIYPVLNDITNRVRAESEKACAEEFDRALRESFERWEKELGNDNEP